MGNELALADPRTMTPAERKEMYDLLLADVENLDDAKLEMLEALELALDTDKVTAFPKAEIVHQGTPGISVGGELLRELDAVILAHAGIARLGRADEITETLDPMLMLPAPAQGALAVECRVDDADLVELLTALDHAPSRAAVTAERAMLATLEAGCSAPIAAHAELAEGEQGDEIYLRGAVISPDGARAIRLSRTGTPADAAEIGKALAADLLDAGADTLMGSTG